MKYKIGDIVYIVDNYFGVQKGCINSNENCNDNCVYYEIKYNCGTANALSKDIFNTYEQALKSMNERIENTKNKYRKEIKTKEDLLNFMFSYSISGCDECENYEARDVAKEKCKELFGIDIKD
jgi:hypothetical protein